MLYLLCILAFTSTVSFGTQDPAGPLRPADLEAKYPGRQAFAANVSGTPSYSTQYAFKNLMRQARPWEISPGGVREFVESVDDRGNLTALPEGEQVYSVISQEVWHPVGTYTLEWDGGGHLEPVGEGIVSITKEGPNRYAVEVVDGTGIILMVREFDPENPFRNIRFWLPDVEQNEDFPFNPEFVDFLEPFGTLRYMDLMGTNDSLIEKWEDRPQAQDQFFHMEESEGVPLEWLCQLANHLNANPWLCMPHGADDAYVRQTAEMVKRYLNPDLIIYLELSNEVWNGNFEQTHYFRRIGLEELGVPREEMPHRAAYAKRAAEMFAIWEEVFGGLDRLQRVAGMQVSTIETAIRTLGYKDYHESFDLLAIAPYFAYEPYETAMFHRRGDVTVDEVLEGLKGVIDYHGSRRVGGHHALAQQYGMGLIAYEAGQHLLDWQNRRAPEPTELTATFIAANRDPRMKDLYLQYFDMFFRNGGEMIGIFSTVGHYSKWGSWGIKEYLSQPDVEAPKYQAVLEAVKAPVTDSNP